MDAEGSTRLQYLVKFIPPLEKYDIVNFDRYSSKENLFLLREGSPEGYLMPFLEISLILKYILRRRRIVWSAQVSKI